uniref:Glutaredoxin n=1 Tax=Leptospirillum ferriphilum TaxID=178606 RepID=A0A7C3LTV7_9BACT
MSQTKESVLVRAYLKPTCGWSNGVRAVLRKYSLPFEDIDIISNPVAYMEMVQKSHQRLSPCVEINGVMLADVSGEEVESYLLQKGFVSPVESSDATPINQGCPSH